MPPKDPVDYNMHVHCSQMETEMATLERKSGGESEVHR